MKTILTGAIVAALAAAANPAAAQFPVSGRPVPLFSEIDNKIQTLMQTNGIDAGVVGINRGERTIYLRSFGWLEKPVILTGFPPTVIFPGINLPETAMFRVASVTKLITAAAVHAMAEDNLLGNAGLNRKAFNMPGNGGILLVVPFGGLGDADYDDITISHLLGHAGGFRRGDDPYNDLRQVATDLNTLSPPTLYEIMRWRLGRMLADTPGAQSQINQMGVDPYSNFGYNVLGSIVELAPGGYDSYVRNRVFGASNWIPNGDWAHGRTFLADRHPREPRYQSTGTNDEADNIYDNDLPYEKVPPPYGGFSMESGFYAGGMISSAQAMLRFGALYHVGYRAPSTSSAVIHNIGSRNTPTNPPRDDFHTGGFAGTCSILDRSESEDGTSENDTVIFIAFAKSAPSGTGYESLALAEVKSVLTALELNADTVWPTAECDGFWVKPGSLGPSGRGGYQDEYTSFAHAQATVTDGSKLQLKAGSSPWTGTITKRLELKAPEGPFTIGTP